MPLRKPLSRTLLGAVILLVATLSVGLTASDDGPFSIVIRPVFLRLGIDVDVKIGSMHFHGSWSALDTPLTTKASPDKI